MKNIGSIVIGSPALTGPRPAPLAIYKNRTKRIFDLFLVLLLSPLALVLILLLAFLVACDGGNPFYGHRRIGFAGRPFACWKLRSMRAGAEAALQAHLHRDPAARREWDRDQKLSRDPRVTRIGAILRRTSLDELPQLWNVLLGEMSLVGPRPITAGELARYGANASAYLKQMPGLTGLWQVNGRNRVGYSDRVAMDMDYARRMSFALDLTILTQTVRVVFTRSGL